MSENTPSPKPRLDVVDALRGFGLLAIVLLHSLEQYNLLYFPENLPAWMNSIDKGIWDTTFFLLAGKAYGTFSLLFGFSFYIQLRNARQRGTDFRSRFAWRMFLLFLFSQFHSLLYNGDILLLYSVIGLLLIPISSLKDKFVFILAILCLLQPVKWGRFVYLWLHPQTEPNGLALHIYDQIVRPVMMDGNLIELIKVNSWYGQLYNNLFQLENGRFFHSLSLFMFGMLLAKKDYFIKSEVSVTNWKKILFICLNIIIPLYAISEFIPRLIGNETLREPLEVLLSSLRNVAFMGILISGFTLVWFRSGGYKFQRFIIPYGRMSLTNYIAQSFIGVTIYYGFGLGLYKYTGSTYCLLIGFAIFALQWIFSRWWLSHYRQGPLEYLWKKGTWLLSKRQV